MAGNWKTRVVGAVGALLAVFAAITIVDTITDDDMVIESGPGLTNEGQDSDQAVDGARAPLATTGTTMGSASQALRSEAVESSAEGTPSASGDDSAGTTERPSSTEQFEPIRNVQAKFTRFADVQSDQLDLAALTQPAQRNDNGGSPAGQFRVACEYSHFGYDDQIIYPGESGASHLHMFFGNTETDAFTTEEELINSGGGTCTGFELNRSAYWTPALLDGKGNAIVPDSIIIYYKTKFPDLVTALPQGLQMLAGNTQAESFETSAVLHWSCGASGFAYNQTNRIPDCNGDVINASVQFPNCWDGVNLASPDFTSHLTYVDEVLPCPSSHPKRLPQITILMYFPGADSVDGWHLASDNLGGFNGPPGGTLHADWWGGWNDETMDLWINGCMKAARNCSYGQTGTPRQLASLNPLSVYEGENFLPLPN